MPPAATMGDKAIGQCIHVYQSTTPSPVGPVPTPVPLTLPFQGVITAGCSTNVLIGGKPAALMGCTCINTPPHPPAGGAATPGPPVPLATNVATVIIGSVTVLVNNKPVVRTGDKALGTGCALVPAIVMGTATTVIIGG